MSTDSHEAPAAPVATEKPNRLPIILGASVLVITLANTVLLVMNPTASHVEQFNESLKSDLAESVASVHKKIDGLRSAEVEWQGVLKKANENPDALYKIVKSADGLLTLTEVPGAAAEGKH